jgi:hypothetical protein
MNGCAFSLKESPEAKLFPSLQVVRMGEDKLLQSREKAFETTSSALGWGANLNYLPQ